MLRRFFACLFMVLLALPLRADPADDVLDILGIDQLLEIMRTEGVAYGQEMAGDLFAGGENPRWQGLLDEIYDISKMEIVVRRNFAQSLAQTDADPILAFYQSDLGERVVALELSARRAMIDDAVEQAARSKFLDTEEEQLTNVTRFIEANDLIEANVAGAMNASFQFYRGLVDGGGFEMSENEILSDVWAQEPDTRVDTREWLYAFLMMAYGPLSEAEIQTYIAFSSSDEGKALNRALFAGFNTMYDEISYALGLAAAQQMQGQDL